MPHKFGHPRRPEALTPAMQLRLVGLTAREAEVALLAAHGLPVRAIAERMRVASGTVKALLAGAREKLECRNISELRVVLLREGLVRPEELVDPREHRTEGA